MEALLVEQRTTMRLISNAVANFNKIAVGKRTQAVAEGRLQLLLERWESCRQLDVKITLAAAAAKRPDDEYFAEAEFDLAEEAFEEAHDHFRETIAKLRPPARAPVNASALGNSTMNEGQPGLPSTIKLPTIELPKFGGCYTEWTNYKSMFDTMIIQHEALNDVQRLHYLKSTLSGEAASLVQHFSVTGDNFKTAWETLTETYEDKRAIIDAHFKDFLSLPAMTVERVKDLKDLRDKTREALKALDNLGCPTESWGPLIVYLTVQKLDSGSAREWEMQLGARSEYPSLKTLNEFLSARIRALEKLQGNEKPATRSNSKSKTSPAATEVRSHSTTTGAPNCLLCDASHALYRCEQFKSQAFSRRKEIARAKDCCFNCLRPGHRPASCPSKFSCALCKKKHHTLLHPEAGNSATSEPSTSTSRTPKASPTHEVAPTPANETIVHHAQHAPEVHDATLLATAVIDVRTATGRRLRIRALLDQGSQSTLIKESLVQILRPKRFPANSRVNGVGEVKVGTARHRVTVYVEPRDRADEAVAISALVMPTLTRYVPRPCAQGRSWEHLHGLTLADPQPSHDMPIELIIGAEYYGRLLRPGLRQGPPCAPTAQATLFGWILSGPPEDPGSDDDVTVHNCTTSDDLPAALARFWEIEELPSISRLSEDEAKCEAHFASTHSRTEDGRYIVRLPFKEGPPISIGESLFRAKSMLNTVDRRLQRDSGLKAEYHAFLSEYEALGHMRAAPISAGNETVSPCVYLPHHPVVRQSSSTTRVRVVFNASSATTNLTSLNDHLLVGPKLQTDITTIITRWRAHRFAYTADIAKMFRQILVDPRDIDYQRILWRREGEKNVTPFQLLTVTYGTASAPFLANRVLLQLADDEGHEFPLGKPVLQNNFYVDDALFGADSIEDARKTRNELNQLLSRGGLHLRKWSANVEELLTDCSREDHELASEIPLKELDAIDVLGIAWNPNRDAFQFRFSPVHPPRLTKRVILSIIARLFDPLGWASPIVISAKIILQELWIRKIEWDVELPDDLVEHWQNYYSQLEHLPKVFIPRWTGQKSDSNAYEIHGFADASSRAYAAVVYLRVLGDLDDAQVTLLIAKTKVAPVNPVSIPRLELCAAVLLARTLRKIIDDLSLADTPVYAWSDSVVTHHWLNKHPSAWQTFVANRVAEIHVLVPKAIWRHVPTKDNPADCASRGLLPLEAIAHPLWWTGPPWLKRHSTFWPSTRAHASNLADLEERKTTNVHVVQTLENPDEDPFATISTWPRLLRVTAYCLRFIARVRRRLSTERTPSTPSSGSVVLKACEVRSASEFLAKYIQKIHFESEIAALRQGRAVASNSRIRRLTPFLDDKGMLRVGGRLANAPIAYDERHPIILPRHRISKLIARQAHARALHGGARLTLKILRQHFWIVKDNTLVKRVVRECVECIRQRAKRPAQLMGDLPSARVSARSPPFSHTGVDYAGPINVRLSKGRGYKTQKAYIALFICFATRAVHLELVSDYATSGFLAAFRRFVARRGIPAAMYSDNGTNFVGADKELRNALRTVARDEDLRSQLISDGTEWHFNPPAAPHFGGLWEAGVKSVKHHLRRMVGSHTLTFEELATLLAQIEACLNSRPIGPLSNDPDDLSCLTPGHFLIGRPLVAIPEPSVLSINENRLSRWQLVQQKVETFWRRWAAEYLHSVQQRNKWTASQPNVEIGDLVLLRSHLSPPSKWQLGRIIDCHPGRDSHVRVVTVKTATSVLKRPIAQLCLLPVRDNTAASE